MKIEEIIEIIEKMSIKEQKMIEKSLKMTEKRKTENKLRFRSLNNIKTDLVSEIYSADIEKFLYILNNKELLEKVRGLKVLVAGETGTGKTSLIKKMINMLPDYEQYNFVAEELISPKMGQTQMNILKLSQQLKGSRKILFIDEVDSIISNRFNNKDLTEYHRITSSFIKMLDELQPSTIVFFSTNLREKIDPAILRRMNFRLEAKKINASILLKNIQKETGIKLTPQKINLLNKALDNLKFTISDLNFIINEINIGIAMNNINEPYAAIIKLLTELGFDINYEVIKSNRAKSELKQEGVNLNAI